MNFILIILFLDEVLESFFFDVQMFNPSDLRIWSISFASGLTFLYSRRSKSLNQILYLHYYNVR